LEQNFEKAFSAYSLKAKFLKKGNCKGGNMEDPKMHTHVFDSSYGYIPGSKNLALKCKCGLWGMPAFGEWHSVPSELAPETFVLDTGIQCITGVLWAIVFELGLGFLAAILYMAYKHF
jgi:hypothetical protein